MSEQFLASATITVKAAPSRVWEALTKPELIKQYLFGTDVTTDWRLGSSITYRGVWEGKPYEDKGKILEVDPGRLLVSSYWSSLSGTPDVSENYVTVRYEISQEDGGSRLTITQDNNKTQADADHSSQNWKMVLDGLKKLLES